MEKKIMLIAMIALVLIPFGEAALTGTKSPQKTLRLIGVDSDQTMCGIELNGQVKWVREGTTGVFGDYRVYVLEAIAVHGKDKPAYCELIAYRRPSRKAR